MKKRFPDHVHGYVDRLGKARHYYKRPGSKPVALPGLPWSPEFMAKYEAAHAAYEQPIAMPLGANRTAAGTLNAALVLYYEDPVFLQLAKGTRDPRRNLLERWRKDHGKLPLRPLQQKHIQAFVSKQASPAVQRNMLNAIRHFTKFSICAGLIDSDPAANVTRARMKKTGGYYPWTEEDVIKYQVRHQIGTQPYLAMQMMLCLSVRKSDAVQIGPRHILKTREYPLGQLNNYQPQKGRRTGGNHVTVPLHENLVAAIAATSVIGTETYLVTSFGKPFTANGFGNKMREWCDEAGLPECSSHGLRKLCLTRLAEAGCDPSQIAAISGHKDLREVQLYVEAANRKKMAKAAMKKLAKAEAENGQTANKDLLTE